MFLKKERNERRDIFMKKFENFMGLFTNWVKNGKGVFLYEDKEYQYSFFKEKILKDCVTIFRIGSGYTRSIPEDVENNKINVVGHYVPNVDKYLSFKTYAPSFLESIVPENNISISDLKYEIGEEFKKLILHEIEAEEESQDFSKTISSERIREILAEIYVKGIDKVLPIDEKVFPCYDISLETVVQYLIGEDTKDLFEEYREKSEKFRTNLKREVLKRKFLLEELKTYVPKENEVSFKEIHEKISEFISRTGKEPVNLRVKIEIDYNSLSYEMKRLIEKTDEVFKLDAKFAVKDFIWTSAGLRSSDLFDISGARKEFRAKTGSNRRIDVFQSWAVPFSTMKEVRYGRELIYKK